RRGMLAALERGADVLGYVDADLSTPVGELRRLVAILRGSPNVDVLLAARVSLLGNDIQRRAMRHYLGRVFASLASLLLRLRVYHPPGGPKCFRPPPALEAALAEPFLSRWAFDVELLGRLVIGTPAARGLAVDRFREVPLRAWADVAGSKLDVGAMARTLIE